MVETTSFRKASHFGHRPESWACFSFPETEKEQHARPPRVQEHGSPPPSALLTSPASIWGTPQDPAGLPAPQR